MVSKVLSMIGQTSKGLVPFPCGQAPNAARLSLHFRLATLNSRRAREMLTVDVADTLAAAVSAPPPIHTLCPCS
jgi:hypothetical protein